VANNLGLLCRDKYKNMWYLSFSALKKAYLLFLQPANNKPYVAKEETINM
jgi:hypothetical protein